MITHKQLFEKFPKIFGEKDKSPMETCMCWGICCDEGWNNILFALCTNIQHHIESAREQNIRDRWYNRALKRAIKNNDTAYLEDRARFFWDEKKEAFLKDPSQFYREVSPKVPQVIAKQVKEKFGTLRFYYQGGDDAISGMVRMAETMSALTCEKCGKPSRVMNDHGWYSSVCKDCRNDAAGPV